MSLNKKQRLLKFISQLPNQQIDRYTLGYWLMFENRYDDYFIFNKCKPANRVSRRSNPNLYRTIYGAGSTNLSSSGYLMNDTGYGKLVKISRGLYTISDVFRLDTNSNVNVILQKNRVALKKLPFKKGDLVKVVRNSYCGYPVGTICSVVELISDQLPDGITDIDFDLNISYIKSLNSEEQQKIVRNNRKEFVGSQAHSLKDIIAYTPQEVEPKPKFKIGDLVKVVRNSYCGYPVGTICSVVSQQRHCIDNSINLDISYIKSLNSEEQQKIVSSVNRERAKDQGHSLKDIIAYTPPAVNMIPAPKFKVGDRVQIHTDSQCGHSLGIIGVITRVSTTPITEEYHHEYIVNVDGYCEYCHGEPYLQLVKESRYESIKASVTKLTEKLTKHENHIVFLEKQNKLLCECNDKQRSHIAELQRKLEVVKKAIS